MKQILVLDENGKEPENMIVATLVDDKMEVVLKGKPMNLVLMSDKIHGKVMDKAMKILSERIEELLG